MPTEPPSSSSDLLRQELNALRGAVSIKADTTAGATPEHEPAASLHTRTRRKPPVTPPQPPKPVEKS